MAWICSCLQMVVLLPERGAQRQPWRCSLRCVRHRSGWHGAAVHCGERQARRNSPSAERSAGMQPQEGEKPTEEKPQEQKTEKTPEEKRKAFGALVRDGGEYSDITNEVMQQAIIKAGRRCTRTQGGCPAAGAGRRPTASMARMWTD